MTYSYTALPRLRSSLGLFVLCAVIVTGCSDESLLAPSEPETEASTLLRAPTSGTAEECVVIDFQSFINGEEITSVDLFGTTLTVDAARFAPNAGPTTARAFDTDVNNGDPDLQAADECPGCDALDVMLVIPSSLGFFNDGDHPWGGTVTFSGFPSDGGFYVKSFTTADNDADEPSVKLYADGTLIGESSGQGNGSVEKVAPTHTVITSQIQFVLGDEPQNSTTGSGSIDNIEICRPAEELGDEGCTLGYWKQEHHFDSWPEGINPSDPIEDYFDDPRNLLPDDDTLLDALNYGGGPGLTGGARILLKQAVAALLNAASTDVDYAITYASIIAQVNEALATGSRNDMTSLAGQLDGYNNAGCPLN